MTAQIESQDWFDEPYIEPEYPVCKKCGMVEYYPMDHHVAKEILSGNHNCESAKNKREAEHLEDCEHDCRELGGMIHDFKLTNKEI